MATIPIRLTLSAAETAVSITALTRSDTGLAPAGVALPIALVATGNVWNGSFTEASPAPSYTAVAQVTFPGGTTAFSQPFQIAGASGPAGKFGTIAIPARKYSIDNLNLWATAPNTGSPDLSLQQGAFDDADTYIISAIQLKGLDLPAQGTNAFAALADIEGRLMGAFLYEANGLQDEKDKMAAHATSAKRLLARLIRWSMINPGSPAALPLASGQTSGVPQSVAPTADDFGRLVATSANPNPYGLVSVYPWWPAF
jgi:hypothetical protein